MGNETVAHRVVQTKRGSVQRKYLEYTFGKAQCVDCPYRAECFGKAKSKARKLQVSTDTAELYALSQLQKDGRFLQKYKKRAAQEWKNAEMKRFHGLARARGFGLSSVATQAKLTALAVNLKRIAALFQHKGGGTCSVIAAFSQLLYKFPRRTFTSVFCAY